MYKYIVILRNLALFFSLLFIMYAISFDYSFSTVTALRSGFCLLALQLLCFLEGRRNIKKLDHELSKLQLAAYKSGLTATLDAIGEDKVDEHMRKISKRYTYVLVLFLPMLFYIAGISMTTFYPSMNSIGILMAYISCVVFLMVYPLFSTYRTKSA